MTNPRQKFYEAFTKNRVVVVCMVVLGIFLGGAILAPWITSALGVNPSQQNIEARYLPVWTKAEGSDPLLEMKLEQKLAQSPEWEKALASELRALGVAQSTADTDAVFEAFDAWKQNPAELLSRLNSNAGSASSAIPEFSRDLQPKSSLHVFGTDELGRDVFARLIFGARVSLTVAIGTGISAALIGLLIGLLAGYFGGIIDTLLMRATDVMLALPVTPLLIVLAAIDFRSLPVLGKLVQSTSVETESVLKVSIILCLFAWMPMARLVRSSVLAIRQSEFVTAAKCSGASHFRIVLRHILPNSLAPLIVAVTLATGENMLFESALSFLGLGIQPPTPSWGNMLQNALDLISTSPFQALVPGLCIFIVGVCINFGGDGLRAALDPRT